MKKIFTFIGIFVSLCVIAVIIIWVSKTRILERALQKQLGVPVSIEQFELNTKKAKIRKLHVGNPKGSRTKTSFSTEKIEVRSSLSQILADPLVVEKIEVDPIFLGIEFYSNNPEDTNWTRILNHRPKTPKKDSKDYLIKYLKIDSLTVSVTKPDGKTQVYPSLHNLEFHNISNKTGFPIDQIEKAIFKLVLQSVIEKYGIDSIIKSIAPSGFPFNVLPFFNNGQKKSGASQKKTPSPDQQTEAQKSSS